MEIANLFTVTAALSCSNKERMTIHVLNPADKKRLKPCMDIDDFNARKITWN